MPSSEQSVLLECTVPLITLPNWTITRSWSVSYKATFRIIKAYFGLKRLFDPCPHAMETVRAVVRRGVGAGVGRRSAGGARDTPPPAEPFAVGGASFVRSPLLWRAHNRSQSSPTCQHTVGPFAQLAPFGSSSNGIGSVARHHHNASLNFDPFRFWLPFGFMNYYEDYFVAPQPPPPPAYLFRGVTVGGPPANGARPTGSISLVLSFVVVETIVLHYQLVGSRYLEPVRWLR